MPFNDHIGQLCDGDFDWGTKLGEGTFGIVRCAIHRDTSQHVAVKRCHSPEDEGVPYTAIREVAALLSMTHENIVKLYDLFFTNEAINLVFEQCDYDLKAHLRTTSPTADQKRELFRQLIRGIGWCHLRNIYHRDLKPQNLLVRAATNTLKIGDFGLARMRNDMSRAYTHQVCTLWYRCPEILLGCAVYDFSIDIWSCGCILAEIATNRPLFPGDSEIGQIFVIMEKLGRPTDGALGSNAGTYKFWDAGTFPDFKKAPLHVQDLPDNATALLEDILQYDPTHRPTAEDIESHPYLQEPPEQPAPH